MEKYIERNSPTEDLAIVMNRKRFKMAWIDMFKTAQAKVEKIYKKRDNFFK